MAILTPRRLLRKFLDKSSSKPMTPVAAVFSLSGLQASVLAGLVGYLVGSFPTAYLVVRRHAGVDIRSAGSGNVGALNSFEVTHSRWVGFIVLLTDCAKGSGSVLLAQLLFGAQEGAILTAAACSVLGHVASPWIGFRGGRGLATGAGAVAVIAWPVIAGWGAIWLAGYFLFRSVNPANAFASVAVLAVVLFLPDPLVRPALMSGLSAGSTGTAIACVMVMILIKLVGPVKEYIAGLTQS